MGSELNELFQQILPLILMVFVSFVVWVASFSVVLRREAERRRRRREGLPPLPPMWKQIVAVLQDDNPRRTKRAEAATPSASDLGGGTPSDYALPDFDMLTAPLPSAPPAPDSPPPQASRIPVTTQSASQAAPAMTSVPLPAGGGELPADAVEVLRVWRDLSDGRLLIGMKDQVFSDFASLQASGLGARFLTLLDSLAQFAPAPSRPAPSPLEAKSGSRLGAVLGVLANPKGTEEAAPLGIAAQIEAFLQARLATQPDLRGRGLHIHAADDGGVQIEADGAFYQGIGDIPDDEIRAFLQETMEAWSARG